MHLTSFLAGTYLQCVLPTRSGDTKDMPTAMQYVMPVDMTDELDTDTSAAGNRTRTTTASTLHITDQLPTPLSLILSHVHVCIRFDPKQLAASCPPESTL